MNVLSITLRNLAILVTSCKHFSWNISNDKIDFHKELPCLPRIPLNLSNKVVMNALKRNHGCIKEPRLSSHCIHIIVEITPNSPNMCNTRSHMYQICKCSLAFFLLLIMGQKSLVVNFQRAKWWIAYLDCHFRSIFLTRLRYSI